MAWAFDLAIVVLILGVTYALVSEGLWGAAVVFFNVLFSCLIALNFYEPLAKLLADNVSAIRSWADFICLSVLFLVTLVILKFSTENMAPTMVRFPPLLLQIGRLAFGVGGAALTVGFLLLVLYTAPVQKKVFGIVGYNLKPPFSLGLDRKLLSFFQWTTGRTFPTYVSPEDFTDADFGSTKVFDPNGDWLLRHQNARPHGEGRVPEPETAAAGGGATEGAAAKDAGGGAPSPTPPS